MYRVIIADDEHWTCELMKKLIHWNELDLALAGQAEDGADAFQLIQKEKPDIVITDIRMPGMDGLEIVRKIKKKVPEVNFIIVSGYKHFEYAFNAIKYGVEDYLLKPLNEQELNQVLQKIRDRLMRTEQHERTEKQMQRRLHSSEDKLKSRLMEEIISGKINAVNEQRQAEILLAFPRESLQVLAIKLDKKDGIHDVSREQLEAVLNKIGRSLETAFEQREISCRLYSHEGLLYGVVNCAQNQMDALQKDYKSIYALAENVADSFQMFYLTMGVGISCKGAGGIKHSVNSAREAINTRLEIGVNRIIFDGGQNSGAPVQVVNAQWLERLKKHTDVADEKGIRLLLEETLEAIRVCRAPVGEKLKEYQKLLRAFYETTGSMVAEAPEKVEELCKRAEQALSFEYSLDRIERDIMQSALYYFCACMEMKKMQMTKPVRDAKKYIQEHYNEELTLEMVAGSVYLSPVYFSVLFKNEEGVNFSKYITEVRLEKAKEYLRDLRYSVAQIAEMVGYRDQRHFSKLFKKVVGITPNEYRKLNG